MPLHNIAYANTNTTDRPVFVFHMSVHTQVYVPFLFGLSLSLSHSHPPVGDTLVVFNVSAKTGETAGEIVLKAVENVMLDNANRRGGSTSTLSF